MNSSDRILENRRWHFRQIIRSSGGNNAVAALMGVSTSYIVILAYIFAFFLAFRLSIIYYELTMRTASGK